MGSLDPGLVAQKVAARMEFFMPGWSAGGAQAVGPGGLAVMVADDHEAGANHCDLGFVLRRDEDDVPVIWDCAVGFGTTPDEIADRVVETWATCTVPVILEVLTRKGEYADHLAPGDPSGMRRWHCIHGPVIGFGHGDGPQVMQRWVLEHPLLPALDGVVADALERPWFNGVKFLFGATVAEVRINGVWDPLASDALDELDWPRLDPPAFARCFVLAVHGTDL